MNPQLEGAIRSLVLAVGGFAAAAGYLKGVDWVTVASAIVSVGGLVWSLWSNRTKGLIEQTAGLDEVKNVDVKSKKLADSIPNTKVTSDAKR